jgi:hypothetical protein
VHVLPTAGGAARIKLPKGGVGRDYVLVQLKINGECAAEEVLVCLHV